MADVEVIEILHEGLHVLQGELPGGGDEPICEGGQFVLVVFEELDAGLALLVVLLLVQVGDFLLNHVLYHVQDSIVYSNL